ncbi:MAG: Hsp20/alpha crystallin family protein [Deltaproteobacteria bacterium]|nr:MAG: Hsp20/alpha crystallin family protein [Deltaproteobacteria bacterium]
MSTEMTRKESQTPEVVHQSQWPTVAPPVDVFENDDALMIVADLPGVDKQDLHLNLENDQLTIEGYWSQAEAAGDGMVAGDLRPVNYRRVFTLPGGLDFDKVEAELKNGVLTVQLPKQEAVKPRRIQVKSA